MAQVFISYAREDLGFVGRLADDLRKKAGLDVWQDLSSMGGGDPWVEKITAAIKESQYVIVVLSPDSAKKSDWVINEILLAKNHKRKIIPLFYRPCDVPLPLLSLDYIDVHGKNYKKNFAALLKALDVDVTKRSAIVPVRPSKIPFGIPTRHLALAGTGVVAAILVGAWIYVSSMQPGSTGTPPPVMTTQAVSPIPATTEPASTKPPITESPPPTTPPTIEPPPTDSPTVEPPPIQPPTTEPSPSAYTTYPPAIDGFMRLTDWEGARLVAPLPLGNLYSLNDAQFLYLLVDVTQDNKNDLYEKKSYDDLTIGFDVNKDKKQNLGDVYYNYSGRNVAFQFFVWSDIVNECGTETAERDTSSESASGFDISPQFDLVPHKFWELRIDLKDIKGKLGENIYAGAFVARYEKRPFTFDDSVPKGFGFDGFCTFDKPIEIYLHKKPPAP